MSSPKPAPTTRTILDQMRCSEENCDHNHSVLELHARCHPAATLNVVYDKNTGTADTTCSICGEYVVRFLIARAYDG